MIYGAPIIIGSFLWADHDKRLEQIWKRFNGWIADGLTDPIDPRHLMLHVWAATQTHADHEPQVAALFATRDLHEPTQGVDIGSRQQILQVIAEVAASGAAVVMASSEYDELAHLCYRVLIFRHGRIAREQTGEDLTETRIAEQCYLA